MKKLPKLVVKNFAQIQNVELELGDLTVLVGAQGTGKSLALQWLKTALDGERIVSALRDAGQVVDNPNILIDLIFGIGMGGAWKDDSEVTLDKVKITSPDKIRKLGNGHDRAFFIPAHRSMLISDGWAAPFQKLTSETPVVARIFSQNLFDVFSARGGDDLFPKDRVLKKEIRELIDRAVFHGGKVGLEMDQQHAKRLRLSFGDSKLPFMTWTAGQREFTPLLLGLYHLLPPRNKQKNEHIDWVIIEEPEMGLHPQAISVFLLLVMELLWRGYRVVVSTHSPHILTAMWMFRRLQEMNAPARYLCDAFDVKSSQQITKVAGSVLKMHLKVHLLEFVLDGRVVSKDISNLDPGSDDDGESGWGGLSGFSSHFGDTVRKAVNEMGI